MNKYVVLMPALGSSDQEPCVWLAMTKICYEVHRGRREQKGETYWSTDWALVAQFEKGAADSMRAKLSRKTGDRFTIWVADVYREWLVAGKIREAANDRR